MKMPKRIGSFILALLMICSMFVVSFADETPQSTVYIPKWMQPNTIIIYDSALNYAFVRGGELTAADKVGRVDIAAVGETSTMVAQPNIKVEYDIHGFIQNIYYPVPGQPGEYQLSNPIRTQIGSGVMAPGTTYTYEESYYNYDTPLINLHFVINSEYTKELFP